jgi:DNA-binding transcriptional MocR family regulator
MPGRYFAVSRLDPGALRLSFAGLPPEQIRQGLAIFGRTVASELENAARSFEPSPAMV